MPREASGTCWKCGSAIPATGYGRRDLCPQCAMDTRVCRNCRFYSESAYNKCREPQAERVVDKEQATFCDWFEVGDPQGEQKTAPDPMAAANAFFKTP